MDRIKLGVVYVSTPHPSEVRLFDNLPEEFSVSFVVKHSLIPFLKSLNLNNSKVIAVPDYKEQPSFMPGIEKALEGLHVVIIERADQYYSYQVSRAKWKLGFKLLFMAKQLESIDLGSEEAQSAIEQEVHKCIDGILVSSKAIYDRLLLKGIPARNLVKFTPHSFLEGGDASHRDSIRETLGIAGGEYVVAVLTPNDDHSCVDELLVATKQLIQDQPSLRESMRLLIPVAGQHTKLIKRAVMQLELEQSVLFVGADDTSDAANYLASADCAFYGAKPSGGLVGMDPFPLLDAMTCGVPIVANRSVLVQDLLGKHRVDFCLGSFSSLGSALTKARSNAKLTRDIVVKNLQKARTQYSMERSLVSLGSGLIRIVTHRPTEIEGFEAVVTEAERLISARSYTLAVPLLQQLVEREEEFTNQNRALLYRLVGDCFVKLGDPSEGKKFYTSSIELDPLYFKPYVGLGTVALSTERYDAAVIHFQKAVSLAPSDEMANLGLGLAFQGIDELEEATHWICQALKITPDNAVALYSLVRLAYERESYDEAESALRAYLEKKPLDGDMLYSLAGILYKKKQFNESLGILDRILREEPEDTRALTLKRRVNRLLLKGNQRNA